jgi:hypothetical protein
MDRASGNPKELLLQLVQENDLRRTNRFAMTGLGWLALTTLGDGPVLDGLGCAPGEGLNVTIAPGAIYQMAPVDSTAYGDLPADPHLILKQGLMQDPITLPCPSPTAPGKSVAYLIQAELQEADIQEPDGEGPAETTVRADRCVVSVKAGVPAATGTETPPTPDEGKVGAWIVTLASGATAVTPADIAPYPGAPFLKVKLPQAAPLHSPVFTGDPQAPTPAAGDDDDSIATTAFVQAALSDAGAFFALKSGSVTSPPSTPAKGDGYLVPNDAVGAWVEHQGQIAIWSGANWRFISAGEGVTVILADTGLYHRRVTGGWRPLMADAAEHVAGLADDLFANPAGVKAAQDAYLHSREAAQPALDDELLIYDASAEANRKITLAELITMPEFDTAKIGEIRPFASQPNDDWIPCTGGTLLKAEYPELFDRIGQLYLDEVTTSGGFSSGLVGPGGATGAFAFGKYWLASVCSGEEGYEVYLDTATSYNGPPTRVIAGLASLYGTQPGAPSIGPDYGVFPLGDYPNRTAYMVFNETTAAVHALPSPLRSDFSGRFATDGTTYAYSSGGNVLRKPVANFVSGSGSWSSLTISGKTNDAFGMIYNSISEKWVCAGFTSVWVSGSSAGPFTQASAPPGSRIHDMLVLADGTYLATTNSGLYVSSNLEDWATLKVGGDFTISLTAGPGGSAIGFNGATPFMTDGEVTAGPIANLAAAGTGWTWDGEGLVRGSGFSLLRLAPNYDVATRFRVPKFLTANGAPPYFIKVK